MGDDPGSFLIQGRRRSKVRQIQGRCMVGTQRAHKTVAHQQAGGWGWLYNQHVRHYAQIAQSSWYWLYNHKMGRDDLISKLSKFLFLFSKLSKFLFSFSKLSKLLHFKNFGSTQ